jgi:hypothetical protein
MTEHQYEVLCGCGATWSVYAADEPEDHECIGCGATVVDLRDLGEIHSAGDDVAP